MCKKRDMNIKKGAYKMASSETQKMTTQGRIRGTHRIFTRPGKRPYRESRKS